MFLRTCLYVSLVIIALGQTPLSVYSQTRMTAPGVPYTLATHRAAILRDIQYDLNFTIPEQKDSPVPATEKLTFTLSDNRSPLVIDFKGESRIAAGNGDNWPVRVNGAMVPVRYEDEHLIVSPAHLHIGTNTVALSFIPGNPALNRNGDFLYTLLVPDRARTLFACFDQPDLKAIFTLSLTIPSGWKAVSNAPLRDSATVTAVTTDTPGTITYRFLPSDRISTYLFSFAAGKFTETTRSVDGRTLHFYYRETDSSKLRLSLDSIFRIEGQALQFMKEYTGIAYPFQKFDFVAIPDFQFGGMEHVGAIQYKASSLFLDSGATREQFIGRSNLLSHETAHMWFGDLVTMSWFNDVWMKEVFANFMADKITEYHEALNVTLPDGNYDLKFLTDHFPAAYSVDRTGGAHPIRQQLDNLQEAGSLYGNIIYHKAPIMMRQLESRMGATAFRDGLRDYLKKYAGGNASWPDLIRILQAHTSSDLLKWNDVWVNGSGRPRLSYHLGVASGKITDLTLHQQGEDGSPRVWPQLFGLALVYKDRVEELTVNMNAPQVRLPAAIGRPAPLCILFNANGQGYGLFPVDPHSIPWLLRDDNSTPVPGSAGPGTATPLMRASAYINLYENMLDGLAVTPRQLLDFDRRALSWEPEELNLNILLDQLTSLFWRWLPPSSRDSAVADIEDDLWQAMQQVSNPNEKKLLFRTYSGIALSRKGEDRLYTIWKTRQPPAGVKLSEEDYTSLAAALALRAYPGDSAILQEQLTRIRNTDRRQRLQYLLPSLSNDPLVRDRFFVTLKDARARRKEAWVLAALSYLHHPLRTAASEKYLPASLEWLDDIQRTGDVFFPQSWLQATFGWYRTRTAAAVVWDFLRRHPAYNPKLKAKILQATDNLFRAEKLGK
ncbi:MAG TPA: M1 family aminopeptidase [Puia sp.]